MSISPSKDPLDISASALGTIYPELDVPEGKDFDARSGFESINKWRKVLRDQLMRTYADALETTRPLSEETERRDSAFEEAALSFDGSQAKVHGHELAEPTLATDGDRKIAVRRREAWEKSHAEWERERASLLASLILKNERLFAASAARRSLKPEDTMDIVTLARTETLLVEEISRIRAMLREAEKAEETSRTNKEVRDALIHVAGDDIQLMEAVTETTTETGNDEPPKSKKKSGGKASRRTRKTPRVFVGRESADDLTNAMELARESRMMAPIGSTPDTSAWNEPGSVVINIPIQENRTLSVSIGIEKQRLKTLPIPDAKEIAGRMSALRRKMTEYKDMMDAVDPKNYMTEISNASVSYNKLMEVADTISIATGRSTFDAIVATMETKLPETLETVNAMCQVNAVKQMLLSALSPKGSEEAGLGTFFRKEQMRIIGDMTMSVGTDKVPPVSKEQAVALRPFFAQVEASKGEETRFVTTIVKATSLYESSDAQKTEDAKRRMSIYLEAIEQPIVTFIKHTSGSPLWILPNMQACIVKLLNDAKKADCMVNRMQHERMARRIAQSSIRLIDQMA